MRPKKVILCVDDNEQELSVLKFMLATNGYRVLAATNGQEAIAIFADNISRPGAGRYRCLIWAVTNWLRDSNSSQPTYRWYCLGDLQTIGGQVHGADALLAKKNMYLSGIAGARKGDERPQTRTPQGSATTG